MIFWISTTPHQCGREYALIHCKDIDGGTSSFSFSLVYFFEKVLPEHRKWFLIEIIQKYPHPFQLCGEGISIMEESIDTTIVELEKIYKNTLDIQPA